MSVAAGKNSPTDPNAQHGGGIASSLQSTVNAAYETTKGYLASAQEVVQPHVQTAQETAQPYIHKAQETAQPYIHKAQAIVQPQVDAAIATAQPYIAKARSTLDSVTGSNTEKNGDNADGSVNASEV